MGKISNIKYQISNIILFFIFLLAFGLRVYGINWDEGRHFHPDERALIMVADKVYLFDQMNPDFFNYGSLPIYLLKGTAQFFDSLTNSRSYTNYDGFLVVGRWLSVFSDMITLVFVYKIAKLLMGLLRGCQTTSPRNDDLLPLFATFFYAVMFFPIQNSHFFVVDVFLTTLTTILVYVLLTLLCHCRYRSVIPVKTGIYTNENMDPRLREDDKRSRIPTFPACCKIRGASKFGMTTFSIKLIVIGLIYGAMMATKVTSLVFLPIIVFGISIPYVLKIFKIKKFIEICRNLLRLIVSFFIFILIVFISFAFFMPYAFIEWERFIRDITAQITMNSDPYIFPYTLQYVGTTPYLYYLKNMFLWGVGIPISIVAVIGLIISILKLKTKMLKRFCHSRAIGNLYKKMHGSPIKVRDDNRSRNKFGMTLNQFLILPFFLLFYFFYFIVLGRSAVKFMRYMLPLYPFIAILAGIGLNHIKTHFVIPDLIENLYKYMDPRFREDDKSIRKIVSSVIIIFLILFSIVYSLMFVNMYSYKNTRISATEWMLTNLPAGAVLGVEHWDDRVPVYGGERFQYEELGLYELPDDEAKWTMMREKIERVDYIVLASNRLYVPLQKLTDCNRYKKCYPMTARYYQELFSEKLGFTKVADFHVFPIIPFSEQLFGKHIGIDDQGADESFTVYDHPRVTVFGRIK
jgi:hypothetical protein